jgi:SAM-dependent methyltransferase
MTSSSDRFSARAARCDRSRQPHRRPRPGSRRRHRHLAAALRTRLPRLRHRYFRQDPRQGPRPRQAPHQCRGDRSDGRRRSPFPRRKLRRAIAQYVITAVPNPEQALDELARVVRPGGEIIITTRIGAARALRGNIEKALMPITSRLGFRTEFSWERYADWAVRQRHRRTGRASPAAAARSFRARPLPQASGSLRMRALKLQADMEDRVSAQLAEQRWDDHRYYHHSLINQSLHFVSASRSSLPTCCCSRIRRWRACSPGAWR